MQMERLKGIRLGWLQRVTIKRKGWITMRHSHLCQPRMLLESSWPWWHIMIWNCTKWMSKQPF
ncbi:hypothetical protein RchiOBHm_Chr6g0245401 [Rosa chinensis]|uniref:Uncharacterized protein n=1 Tax=Rosa chinensis TaxID=74649 RepID=A0A2P6PJ88_ROSCH|nr:hypothetical protein RchiOBHm_Chr6g0245401 [Rosa chinensis]